MRRMLSRFCPSRSVLGIGHRARPRVFAADALARQVRERPAEKERPAQAGVLAQAGDALTGHVTSQGRFAARRALRIVIGLVDPGFPGSVGIVVTGRATE